MGRLQVLPTVGQVQMPLLPRGQPISGGPDHRQPRASSPGRTCNQTPWALDSSHLPEEAGGPVDLWDLRDSLSLPEQGKTRGSPLLRAAAAGMGRKWRMGFTAPAGGNTSSLRVWGGHQSHSLKRQEAGGKPTGLLAHKGCWADPSTWKCGEKTPSNWRAFVRTGMKAAEEGGAGKEDKARLSLRPHGLLVGFGKSLWPVLPCRHRPLPG